MTAVMIIVFIESMGMFLALGEIVGRKLTPQDIIRGLRVDGVGTYSAGCLIAFRTPPSRRTLAWSASPASIAAGSAWHLAPF